MTRARDIADFGSVTTRLDTVGGSSGALSNRRLTINGEMQVAQRGSVAAIQTGYGACDRFKLASNSAARFDTTQSTDVPSGQGFSKSLKLDCSTADTSLAAGEFYQIRQEIEGQNLQQLLYGSSSAKQCTLSFWVKSPKTGIHNLEVKSSAGGVFNIHQYTIASANTWQNVKITFDGYQTTAIANDNTAGLVINWWLLAGTTFTGGSYSENSWTSTSANRAVGQVNVADSTSNDFYLTGVQLEVGSTATDFEHRSFGDELLRCQRYFNRIGKDDGSNTHLLVGGVEGSSTLIMSRGCPVNMRAVPTCTIGSGVKGFTTAGGVSTISSFASRNSRDIVCLSVVVSNSHTLGQSAVLFDSTTDGYIDSDAEL